MKCTGCIHAGENKTLQGSTAVKSQPSIFVAKPNLTQTSTTDGTVLKHKFDRLKGKKFLKAESNPKHSKSNYFEVINSESSVLTVLFSWTPFVESKWQKGLTFTEKYYPLRSIFPACIFNEVCRDDCGHRTPNEKCEEKCQTNLITQDCNSGKLCKVNCSSFGMCFGYYAVLQLIIDVVIICGSDVCHFSGSHSLETRTCIICELKVYF